MYSKYYLILNINEYFLEVILEVMLVFSLLEVQLNWLIVRIPFPCNPHLCHWLYVDIKQLHFIPDVARVLVVFLHPCMERCKMVRT